MYSLLYAQTIRNQQEETAGRTMHRPEVREVSATASRIGRVRRHALKAAVAFGVCVAAIASMAISGASARESIAKQRVQVSARQLEREITALRSVGFVATSCEVGGTRMKNYATGQSVLLPS
jgi:hypothetical protein